MISIFKIAILITLTSQISDHSRLYLLVHLIPSLSQKQNKEWNSEKFHLIHKDKFRERVKAALTPVFPARRWVIATIKANFRW